MAKSPLEERSIIVASPAKRPYGALVCIHVQTGGALGRAEEVGVPLSTGAFITIGPSRMAPWEGGKKYNLKIEGFPTAAAAEAAGRRLAQAVLWMGISTDSALRLVYQSYEPAAVFERNRPDGLRVEGYGEASYHANAVLGELQEAYAQFNEVDPKVLLSMEIFSGARLEASERARFLSVISALEPLADAQPLAHAVDDFVASCIENLASRPDLSASLRRSLEGRLQGLRRESIRQALHRAVSHILPDRPDATDVIDQAYGLRSALIHDGRPADLDLDLGRETAAVSALIREIYARLLGRRLLKSIAV